MSDQKMWAFASKVAAITGQSVIPGDAVPLTERMGRASPRHIPALMAEAYRLSHLTEAHVAMVLEEAQAMRAQRAAEEVSP